jgi:hypothetical protein
VKEITCTLLAILVGLLINKYYPFATRKLLMEYMVALFLSLKLGNFVDIDNSGSKVILQ